MSKPATVAEYRERRGRRARIVGWIALVVATVPNVLQGDLLGCAFACLGAALAGLSGAASAFAASMPDDEIQAYLDKGRR